MPYILLIIVGIAIALVVFVIFGRNLFKPKLSAAASAKIAKQWKNVMSLTDPHRQILEADSVLDMTFKELGVQGSLGDKLKKMGKFLPNENEVWRAHKTRNRIAHEPGTQISQKEVADALSAFKRAIDVFSR